MECIREGCKSVNKGRSKYCSDSCKVLHNRKQSLTVNSETVNNQVNEMTKRHKSVNRKQTDPEVLSVTNRHEPTPIAEDWTTSEPPKPGDTMTDGAGRKYVYGKKIRSKSECSKLSKDQLYSAISSYKADTWVNSPEHKELMRRIETWPLEKLVIDGYWIPAWKSKCA